MNRTFTQLAAIGLCAVTLVGCAGGVSNKTMKSDTRYEESKGDRPTSQSGVLTVHKVRPMSQIAIIAPDVEHVVWRRHVKGVSQRVEVYQEQGRVVEGPVTDIEVVGVVMAKEQWPLLAEDMNFATKIRDLDMCAASNEGCQETSCWKDLEPCVDPGLYLCFTTKPGNYCLERNIHEAN